MKISQAACGMLVHDSLKYTDASCQCFGTVLSWRENNIFLFIYFIYISDIAKVNFSVIILNSGIQIPDSGFRIPDSGFRIPVSGFQFPDSGFRIPALRVANFPPNTCLDQQENLQERGILLSKKKG